MVCAAFSRFFNNSDAFLMEHDGCKFFELNDSQCENGNGNGKTIHVFTSKQGLLILIKFPLRIYIDH